MKAKATYTKRKSRNDFVKTRQRKGNTVSVWRKKAKGLADRILREAV
jgi:hypothetical protein